MLNACGKELQPREFELVKKEGWEKAQWLLDEAKEMVVHLKSV